MRLDREQAAVLTLFTGVVCGPAADAVLLASLVLQRPVAIAELASTELLDELHELIAPAFAAIAPDASMPPPAWPALPHEESPG